MTALVLLIVLSLCFSIGAFLLFVWAQRSGQFDLVSADGQGQGAELPLVECAETEVQSKDFETENDFQKRSVRKGEVF